MAQTLEFGPEDIPLKDDVNTLGQMLGETLIKIEGPQLFNLVERVRQVAIERRSLDGEAREAAESRLTAMLSGLDATMGVTLARAFSAYFGLVNMAERMHGIRLHLRDFNNETSTPESYAGVLQKLKDDDIGVDTLAVLLSDLRFTPVFTAHPTEAVRRSLLTKEMRIAQALARRLEPELTTSYTNAIELAKVRDEIGLAWQTDELFDQPTVADEVEHVLFFLCEVVYRIIPAVYRRLDDAVQQVYGKDIIAGQSANLVRFASWVGGDMDGNPNVDASTILATLSRQRELIIERYRDEVNTLFQHLTHSQPLVRVSTELQARLESYKAQLPAVAETIPERYRAMPYRVLLSFMQARLAAVLDDERYAYGSSAELLVDIRLLLDSMRGHGDTGSYLVRRFLRRVETFGFHLLTLDIRQDSVVHRAAVGQALAEPEFINWSAEQRVEHLSQALQAMPQESVTAEEGSELAQCLAVMQAIKQGLAKYGREALGPYIISMAEGADDALAVLYLARLAGLVDDHDQVPLDIAPLFETVIDLNNARATMTALLQHPLYRQHLRSRNDQQVVMLGYSDSNKESGIAASRWALFSAQQQLVAAADIAPGNPLNLTLFHGRGGTISRGGSGLHPRNGILAEPVGAVRGRLRVTEQGEIISQKYGLRDTALHTIEMVTGALLERCALQNREIRLDSDWLQAAQLMAEHSRQVYRELVYDDPDLIDYFRSATPIDAIERLRIGSRPASRRSGKSAANLRAIPWVFAWAQSRHSLTGWYGVGAGLALIQEQFGIKLLREMAAGWRFFANLISDTEMVLAKADMAIAKHYAGLAGAVGERIYPRLLAEFEQTERCICDIQQTDELLGHEPILQRNIRLRNPYVDPLSLLQVDFLRRWRAAERNDPELERALVITIKGIARGMQNTG